jgi:hypothetical protein
MDERIIHHNSQWKGNVEKELPPNMPEPRGRSATISTFVDANHEGNVITRRSRTVVSFCLYRTHRRITSRGRHSNIDGVANVADLLIVN